jgi:acyl carrier protein
MDGQHMEKGDIVEQILDVIAKEGMVDRARITLDSTLEDLQLKSMDIVVILTGLEEKFSVYIPIDGPLAEAKNVREFVDHVMEQLAQQQGA